MSLPLSPVGRGRSSSQNNETQGSVADREFRALQELLLEDEKLQRLAHDVTAQKEALSSTSLSPESTALVADLEVLARRRLVRHYARSSACHYGSQIESAVKEGSHSPGKAHAEVGGALAGIWPDYFNHSPAVEEGQVRLRRVSV